MTGFVTGIPKVLLRLEGLGVLVAATPGQNAQSTAVHRPETEVVSPAPDL